MKYLLPILLAGLLWSCTDTSQHPTWHDATEHLHVAHQAPFYHGVASGDPLTNAVILWTRVTPVDSLPEIAVRWEVSPQEDFSTLTASGEVVTTPARDYTVKVDAQGLAPGTAYYYRFQALEGTSPTGRTRTAPTTTEAVNLAVVSCSNYEFGYFNAYATLAQRTDLDAVVHLGDYIYELEPGAYGDSTTGRLNLPNHELIALSDYRTRYAQYRLDPDLQAVHARHPFINIWDDHEIANNAYKDGAQNHDDSEGPYEVRRSAAVQSYYEWLPIREGEHYRAFQFGQLAHLIMLDERLAGRTAPAEGLDDPSLQDEDRTMLGTQQMAWLQDQLTHSTAQWKVIGNQVIFSYLNWGYEGSYTINLDSWDGYPQEQRALADFVRAEEIENLVFITGDTHTSFVFEATPDPFGAYHPATGSGAIGVEFGTTSINSGNANDRPGATDEAVLAHEARVMSEALNPHLKYVNMRDHGYLLLSLTPEAATGQFYYVQTMHERNAETVDGPAFRVKAAEVKLRSVERE